jgi:hypothetical protein
MADDNQDVKPDVGALGARTGAGVGVGKVKEPAFTVGVSAR